ncbi:MAG: hypothetical protein Q9220_001810 [cf. Caloplaca sp. 1 TL-2023]
MSIPPSAGGQPPSFKTNVNRAKTKRWVEAKSYSYDGDDWGEIDEYDEYGGYDEPPQPTRPTGLRQRGQSASREQQGPYPQQQPDYGPPAPSQHGYGNLARQPPTQQQHEPRSATNPLYHHAQMQRPGSFDRGDERRAFSAAVPHQTSPPRSEMHQPQDPPYMPGPAPEFQGYPPRGPAQQNYVNQPGPPLPPPTDERNGQDPNLYQDRDLPPSTGGRPTPAMDQPRQMSMGNRTQSMTSNTSAADFQNRRDFTPSAVPPPLHTRGTPSPQRGPDSQSAFRPPRKSSLSQQNNPENAYSTQGPDFASVEDTEDARSMTRGRAGSDITKPLPFVRPADIYRRMQEEKERERQSQESSRPSMDVITNESQTKDDATTQLEPASNRDRGVEPRHRSRSSLDPVAERKSEYGMSGFMSNENNTSNVADAQQPAAMKSLQHPGTDATKHGLSPQLPDVARMSGFGELFGGPSSTTNRRESQPMTSIAPRDTLSPTSTQALPDSALQHQPSIGLRSVVHQAFDTTDEAVPETPVSSVADSSIGRSGSGGTSAVSPIISRGPSSATANLNALGPQIRPSTPPAAPWDVVNDHRPQSSGSLGTPKATTKRISPDFTNQRPGNFIPGHRRDLSTPSPDNSPARTPALEMNRQLQQPQEAELAITTPIDTYFPQITGRQGVSSDGQLSPVRTNDTASSFGARGARDETSETGSINPPKPFGETPKSPAESTRSRVRNLADRFESGRSSPAGSERAPSPVKTNFIPSQASYQPRPLPADRLESFRPKLPGGWESSASLAPMGSMEKPEIKPGPASVEKQPQYTGSDHSAATAATSRSGEIPADIPSPEDEVPPSDPFASLAAAGSALAGAFSSTHGSEKDEKNRDLPIEPKTSSSRQSIPQEIKKDSWTTPSKASGNAAFLPEASKSTMLTTPDDGTSSIMPTPLDKMPQPAHSGQSKAPDYFAGVATPKQQASGDSYASEDSSATKRSQMLTPLTTDATPQYESDRLRREIIRELSPRLTSEPRTTESNSPLHDFSRPAASSENVRQQHESFVLPREYDSYWNDSSSGQSSRASSVRGPSKAVRDAMQKYEQKNFTASPHSDLPIGPSVPTEEAPHLQDEHSARPEMLPHRFSWEGPAESIAQRDSKPEDVPKEPLTAAKAEEHGLPGPEGSDKIIQDSQPGQQALDIEKPPLEANDSDGPPYIASHDQRMESQHGAKSLEHLEFDQPAYSSLSESTPRDAPLSTPDDRSSQGHAQDDNAERASDLSQRPNTHQDIPPLPALPNAPIKMQNFREILALKNPKDRIQAYNTSRDQYANMDTGLAHWLAVTTMELPEHQDVMQSGRVPGVSASKPPASRSKLGALLTTGSSTSQQPYYQQYLNASSPMGSTDGNQGPAGSSAQGYSPSASSGKLSSQQMQARGKDLLHSAGVFGGKANVAAKGLFSKGKSKLRGGNADKV